MLGVRFAGGVFKSTNTGKKLSQSTENESLYTPRRSAINPKNTRILYPGSVTTCQEH